MNVWSLRFDLASVGALVWLAATGRDADLTPEAHLFFFDRYSRLAQWHRDRGHERRARRCQARADGHWTGAGGYHPPTAAAMAMPRPRRWIRTDAIGRMYPPGGSDAA